MNIKLINILGYVLLFSFLGFGFIISSAFMKITLQYDFVRYIILFIGVGCLAIAGDNYITARQQAKKIDTEIDTQKKEMDRRISRNTADIAVLDTRTTTMKQQWYDDFWFKERVAKSFFQRDKHGNLFVPGSIYSSGEIAAFNDTITVEEIRKVVGRETTKVGDTTIRFDNSNQYFRAYKKPKNRKV